MFFRKILALLGATLFIINATAQTPMNKYDKAWKKIDSLINKKGLTQSALTEVNKLYTLATKENQQAQQVKALLYKMGLQEMKEEDALLKSIQQLEQESSTAGEPVRSILNSITAERYWNYFQQHRWQLYNRTKTIDFRKKDISTWAIDDFHRKIGQLYLESLKNEKLLQQTKLEPFDAIIIKGNVRHLRPTLFDLLAHRALDYFRNDEQDLNKPSYAFELDQASTFDAAADFINRKFPTKDSLSLHHEALLLYQRLIAFHLNDKKPDALIDADIDRLAFVHQYAVMDNKEELYKNALTHIGQQYENHPAAAQAWYLLAQWHSEKAGEEITYDGYSKAKEICDKIIAQKDSSEGKINAQNLLNSILKKQLNLQTEKVNLPNQPFRMLITYRNINQSYFRLVTLTKQLKDKLKKVNNWQEEYWPQLLQLPVAKAFTQPLPAVKDYRQHQVEVSMEGLPVGEYILLASTDPGFSMKENAIAAQFFYASAIAYLNNGNNFFVVHREMGIPLARTNVQVWYRYYDYATQKNVDRKGENLFTDKNGFFKIEPPKTNSNNNYRLELTNGDDHLFMEDENYNSFNYATSGLEKDVVTSFLFTDRSIYRPGQIVYFKGIVINRNNKSSESNIVPGHQATIILYDANGQKADSLQVQSNEYGSYSGKFTLPQNQLNGSFRIEDNSNHSNLSFLVEEYKRPKFSVEIAKPSGTYKLNDNIKTTGTAKAYAGNSIDGAMVKYRVVRQTRWPIWFDYYRRGKIWPPRRNEEFEIAHGELKTDAKGEFIINFKAIPDGSIDKKDQPTFYYEVSADVTDINGETRSGNTSVAVAYQALQLSINTPDELPASEFKNLLIRSANLNGIFEKATVTVTIHKLKQPNRTFRNRYWEQPDQFLMSEEEYHTLFPYDIYKDENLVANWPKQEKIAESTDTTSETANYKLPTTNFSPGWYQLEVITKDKNGETVKAVKNIHLTGKQTTNPTMFGSVRSTKSEYEPGEKATYTLETNLDSIWVIHHLTRVDKDAEQNLFTLAGGAKSFDIPITEADRGGVALDMSFVKHNRVFTDNTTLSVPYTNKQLKISYETFRDKTLPGGEEKWKVKISGYKTDKVAAEMLTAMYDASLDQFQPHSWTLPSIWNKSAFPKLFNGDRGFTSMHSQNKDFEEPDVYVNKVYDEMMATMGMLVYAERAMYSRNKGVPGAMQVAEERGFMNQAAPAALDSTVADKSKINGDWNKEGEESQNKKQENASIQIRRNFNETAFFIPDLKTDSTGNIEFSFTMPEALTQWKWMTLAHTKNLAFGYSEKTIVTQKELMVQPNAPRFVREGDRMDFTTKIVNLTGKELTGQVQLQLIDPSTNQSVDGWFNNFFPNQYFTVPAGQSVPASFSIGIPFQYNKPVLYRLIARAGEVSDGEEMMLPVLSNRMLVTESLPLNMRGSGTKEFKFVKLINSGEGKSGASETLNHQALTVEFTSNPAWYAVQALPYLMEYPYECSEQTFNQFYANTLATHLSNSSPRIKEVFEKWLAPLSSGKGKGGEADSSALWSNLQKNQELKSVLLQETPWVLQANNETQQKKNIALLFDMVRMSREMEVSLGRLFEMQSSNGGFVWFTGGPDDRYITQYILTGIGHLRKLNALPKNNEKINTIIKKAMAYLDNKIKEDYDRLVKNKANLNTQQLGTSEIQYLYMRSFFTEMNVPGESFKAYNYYRKQAQQYWVKESRYMQGMIALGLHRTGDIQTAKDIIKSLLQNALTKEELGMYWKEFNTGGYYWYQSPIESHALLTEAFSEINKNSQITDDLKTWLLKQKQTHNWRTTKATADACYVLLLEGSNWLVQEPKVEISLGSMPLNTPGRGTAGEGYFKKVIDGTKVNASMGNISVTISQTGQPTNQPVRSPSWGAVYWQYFEELDKITPSATPLKLVKKLFVEKNTDRGPVLQPLKEGEALHVGDKVKVRIELRVDRSLEYVHMKDMRASSLEPVNVISQYKWQGGLGYYESTKDASTNFFFGYLPRGTWVFEYPLFVTHTGTFSNGITTIQCMYAPEFTSHSEGIKITVE